MKIIEGGFGKKACSNLSADLREMADAVDRGEILDLISVYVQNDNYTFLYGTSISYAVTLSSLLQQQCINRMRTGE